MTPTKKIRILKADVVWNTSENSDATRSLKQHAFIHKTRKAKYIGEQYNGNISLCGKICISEDGERSCEITVIDSERLEESKACKVCLKRFIEL